MARVYTSRQLIDPNLASYMEQVIQNRVANEANRNKEFLSSTRNMLSSVGSAADDYIGRFQREKELQNAEANKNSVSYIDDPTYRSAREEYIRTGSSQPITSYMLQKEAAEARKLEAQKREDEAAANKARDTNIRRENDRTAYLKAQKDMLDAMKAGDYSSAEIYKSQMNSIENRWEPGTFGKSSDELYDARKREIDEAAAKKAIEERDERMMRESEALEKKEAEEKAANSYSNRIFVETEVIPNLKNVQDKAEAKAQVERLYKDGQLSMDDRKALHDKIDGTETVGEGKQRVRKQKAEEATGKAIDENRNKADAKKYVGQKMSKRVYDGLDENIRKYIILDAQGIVKEVK